MEQKAFNKHRVLTRKEPHLNPLAFFNANIMLMREYFPNVTFYNFKTKNIDMLRLRRGLLYGCFPFQFTFITKKETQLDKYWNCPAFKNNYPKPLSSRWYTRTSST
jgi:hypothetical protein